MAGLVTGVIGSLMGGIQTVIDGISIPLDAVRALNVLRSGGAPVSSKNWSPTTAFEQQNPSHIANPSVGQQVNDAVQVIGSCIQIAKALEGVIYPASRPTSVEAFTSADDLTRVKDQSCCRSAAQVNNPVLASTVKVTKKEDRCVCLQGITQRSTNIPSPCTDPIKKSCAIIKFKAKENGKRKKQTEEMEEDHALDFEKENLVVENKVKSGQESDIFMLSAPVISNDYKQSVPRYSSTLTIQTSVAKTKPKFIKPGNTSINSPAGRCPVCQDLVKEVNNMRSMPCGHKICDKCLTAGNKYSKCPKCGVRFYGRRY